MQRIMVDLPEPDGPQTTTFCPFSTARLQSFRTWNCPYHLLTWSSRIMGPPFVAIPRCSLVPVTGVEAPLERLREARHGKAEDPEAEAREDVGLDVVAEPFLADHDQPRHVQEVVEAHDEDERRVLEQRDEAVDDAGNDEPQRLGQDDQPHALPVAEPHGLGRLVLALGDGLEAAADHLGEVGAREDRDADERTGQLVDRPAGREEQRQHHRGHEQYSDQRHAADDLDEGDAQAADDRQVGAPPEGEDDAERERGDDADYRDQERQEQAAPQVRVDLLQPGYAASEQLGGDDRVDDEEAQQVPALAGPAAEHQRGHAHQQQHAAEDDAPVLVEGVEPEEVLPDPVRDHPPAGAVGPALVAVRRRPARIDEQPAHQRRDDPDQQADDQDRQDRVERRREQVLARPPDDAEAG